MASHSFQQQKIRHALWQESEHTKTEHKKNVGEDFVGGIIVRLNSSTSLGMHAQLTIPSNLATKHNCGLTVIVFKKTQS